MEGSLNQPVVDHRDSPCRIVLADDHVLVRQGIRKLIEVSPDLQVVGEASDGSELFELLRNVKADLAILDITMPIYPELRPLSGLKPSTPDSRY